MEFVTSERLTARYNLSPAVHFVGSFAVCSGPHRSLLPLHYGDNEYSDERGSTGPC